MQNRQRHIGLCFVLVAALALLVPAAAGAWTWPVEGPVLQPFLFDELTPEAPGQHRGISIGAPVGTPVRAPVDATITFAGTVPYGGKTLSLLAAGGLSVTLLHLGSFEVTRGMSVAEGQLVGSVGPSAGSELGEPFLYLGVRRVEDPQGYLDPLLFLPAPVAQPSPVDPPPAPVPAPAAPPPVAVTPSAPAPVEPPAVRSLPPRLVTPGDGDRVRPTVPKPSWNLPVSPSLSPHWTEQTVAFDLPPTHRITTAPSPAVRTAMAQEPASGPAATPLQHPLADRGRTTTWVRSLDRPQAATSADPRLSRSPSGPDRRTIELLGATLAALALMLQIARRGRGGGARIIGGDALLPDDTDLLREREPAHRSRVHDDRRGRARPAPQAAR